MRECKTEKNPPTVDVPTPAAFQTRQTVKTSPPIISPVELGLAGGPRLPCQRATPHRKNAGGRVIATVASGRASRHGVAAPRPCAEPPLSPRWLVLAPRALTRAARRGRYHHRAQLASCIHAYLNCLRSVYFFSYLNRAKICRIIER